MPDDYYLGRSQKEQNLEKSMLACALEGDDYPDLDKLEQSVAGEACAVPLGNLVAEDTGEKLEKLTALREILQRMLHEPNKSLFHDNFRETVHTIALIEKNPQHADLSWVPFELPEEVVRTVAGPWASAEGRVQDLVRRRDSLEQEWIRIDLALRSAREAQLEGAPAVAGDSDRDRRSGWNREWTWQRRAEFTWALAQLEKTLVEREERFHSAARVQIAQMERHVAAFQQLRDESRAVDREYLDLVDGRNPRQYLLNCTDALDGRRMLLQRLQEDLLLLREEQRLLNEKDKQHTEHYQLNERPGGQALVVLEGEEKEIRNKIAALPHQHAAALKPPNEQLVTLQHAKEEEIQRALRHSQEFLAKNEREQEACRAEMQRMEEDYVKREKELQVELKMNLTRQRETEEQHSREAEQRQDMEMRRRDVVKGLKADMVKRAAMLNATIQSSDQERRVVTDVLNPLYNTTTLLLVNNQRECMALLDENTEEAPKSVARCLGPLCVTIAKLTDSLINTCQDLDEMMHTCQMHVQFCRDTDDPEVTTYSSTGETLLQRRDAFLVEAHDFRARLERALQLWEHLEHREETDTHPRPLSLLATALPLGSVQEVMSLGTVPQPRRLTIKQEHSSARRAQRAAPDPSLGLSSPRPSSERRRRRDKGKVLMPAMPRKGAHRLPAMRADPHAMSPIAAKYPAGSALHAISAHNDTAADTRGGGCTELPPIGAAAQAAPGAPAP